MIVECPGCGVHFEVTASEDGSWSYYVVPAFKGVLPLVCEVRMDAVRGRHPPCPHEKKAVRAAMSRLAQ